MLKFFPTNDPAMTLRLNRQLMAVYSYFLIWGGTVLGIQLGLASPDTPHLFLFASLLTINAVIFALIRSGASRVFADPSMTMAQMLAAIALITILMHYVANMRGAMLSIYFMIMTFAVFSLGRGKMIAMSAVIMAAFSALLGYEHLHAPDELILAQAIGQWVILLLGLAWFVFVGGYIYNLQLRIREQRESLRDNQLRLEESNQQLREAMSKLSELAVRDHLTGLYNRRHFMERLKESIAVSERSHDAFHLALIDLDNFKLVNDQHGHQVGDEVLLRFAQVARDALRRTDVLARYGGEEFIVLFPHGNTEGITEVLERLRQTFADLRHDHLISGLQVSLSVGLTVWQQSDDANSLVQRADKALYKAKDLGRNRLHFS